MQARRKWQAIGATAASSVALLGMSALDTGAMAAGTVHRCGNKTYTIQIAQETTPQTYRSFPVHAKNILASGLSCSAAIKFIGHVYNNKTTTTPEHFKCTTAVGKYKEPQGYFPEVCTHKGAKVVYGAQGG